MTSPVIRAGTFTRSAWNAALARGIGYEPQPLGMFDGRTVGDYFVDLRLKIESDTRAENLEPGDLAQLALGWWGRLMRSEDPEAGERFDELCDLLARQGVEADDGLRWPYHVDVPKYRLTPPWHSALAQGQIASVFVRAAWRTGRDECAEIARRAVGPLLVDSDLVSSTPAGPILEETPAFTESHILNGWIYALWGLWDVHVGLNHAPAGDVFEASSRCLASMVDEYDLGWWTRYSLIPGRGKDIAKPFYHRLHADQASVMFRLTGYHELAAASRRWRDYDRVPNRVRAIATKAGEVAARRT